MPGGGLQRIVNAVLHNKGATRHRENGDKGDQAVMSIRNFGEKSLDELRLRMVEKGYMNDDTENELE